MSISVHILKEHILNDHVLASATVGSKLPNNVKLAEQYGASTPTVVKALRLLSQAGWVNTRRGSGAYVAAIPSRNAGHSALPDQRIGCVVQDLSSSLPHRLVEGVEAVARRKGIVVEVATCAWNLEEEQRQIEAMRRRGVQGVVLNPSSCRGNTYYLANALQDFPIVVADLYLPEMKRPHVLFDNVQAGREMTRFLLKEGRRDIVFLRQPEDIQHRALDDRFAGYRLALDEAGIAFEPKRVPVWNADWTQYGKVLARAMALRPRPTAIITPQDPCAEAAVAWLRKNGVRVPEDVAVAGFDNMQHVPWTERFPTTRPDFVNMGERAAEMLLDRIKSRDLSPTGLILPCPLLLPVALSAAWHTDDDNLHGQKRFAAAG